MDERANGSLTGCPTIPSTRGTMTAARQGSARLLAASRARPLRESNSRGGSPWTSLGHCWRSLRPAEGPTGLDLPLPVRYILLLPTTNLRGSIGDQGISHRLRTIRHSQAGGLGVT